MLRLQESLQPTLGEEGGRGLDIEDDDLTSHCAHLDQGQLTFRAQVDPLAVQSYRLTGAQDVLNYPGALPDADHNPGHLEHLVLDRLPRLGGRLVTQTGGEGPCYATS